MNEIIYRGSDPIDYDAFSGLYARKKTWYGSHPETPEKPIQHHQYTRKGWVEMMIQTILGIVSFMIIIVAISIKWDKSDNGMYSESYFLNLADKLIEDVKESGRDTIGSDIVDSLTILKFKDGRIVVRSIGSDWKIVGHSNR